MSGQGRKGTKEKRRTHLKLISAIYGIRQPNMAGLTGRSNM